MQLRARKLSEHLPEDSITKLKEIQSSIKIKRETGTYKLDWRINQTDYSFTMVSDPFKFYEKGDNARHNAKRGENLNYRTLNWNASLELWKDIFKTSNLDSELICDDGKLAFGNFLKKDDRNYSVDNIIIALIFFLISLIKYPLINSLQVFFVVVVLLLYADSFSSVHLRKPMRIFEKILVASGSLLPLYFGVDPTGMLFSLAALYLLTKAEKNATIKLLLYALSGMCFGVAAYIATVFTMAIVIALSILLITVSLVDCMRVKKSEALLFIICAVVSISLQNLVISYGYFPEYSANIVEYGSNSIFMISSIFLFVLAACFSLWWITGVQYYLLPWLSLLSLSLATAYTLYTGDDYELFMLGVFTGFISFLAYRVFGGLFFRNKRIVRQ